MADGGGSSRRGDAGGDARHDEGGNAARAIYSLGIGADRPGAVVSFEARPRTFWPGSRLLRPCLPQRLPGVLSARRSVVVSEISGNLVVGVSSHDVISRDTGNFSVGTSISPINIGCTAGSDGKIGILDPCTTFVLSECADAHIIPCDAAPPIP